MRATVHCAMEVNMTEHERLKAAIAEIGISQAEFARQIGTQSPQVTRWVKWRRPNRWTREQINRYFRKAIYEE